MLKGPSAIYERSKVTYHHKASTTTTISNNFAASAVWSWLTGPRTAYLKRFVRASKNEPLVDKVEVVNANSTYRAGLKGGQRG